MKIVVYTSYISLLFLLAGSINAVARPINDSSQRTNRSNDTQLVSLSQLMRMHALIWDQQSSQWYVDTSLLKNANLSQSQTVFDNSEVFDADGSGGSRGTGGNW